MRVKSVLIAFSFVIINTMSVFSQNIKELTEGFKLVVDEGFSEKTMSLFAFSDSTEFLISKKGSSGKALKCLGEGSFKSLVDGPCFIALLMNEKYADFVMEFDFLQEGRDFAARDMSVIFGYTDPTHFYYAQAATEASKTAHNIFKVDGVKPQRIGQAHTTGMIWKYDQWHRVVFEQRGSQNKIRLFVDDVLVAESAEKDIPEGHLGFGTFVSAFKIDNLKIWVPATK
jgi:hypothetical protein